ncbi:RNase H domain-containing protein [Trichonephila clavipes]|nr:RNase H domain-containing protein [Trichonephila clavipes]
MRCTSSTSQYYSKLYSYGDQHRTSTYLKNWTKFQRLKRDSLFSRADKLNLLFSEVEPCLLEANICFNDLADELVKEGSNDPICSSDLLICNEIYSKIKTNNNKTWKTQPSHDWYQLNGPGAALELKDDRKLQTALTRLISDHTRGPAFVQGQKTFPVCLKCNVHQASSEHLLSRIGLEKNFILENPTMVSEFLLMHGLLDLV